LEQRQPGTWRRGEGVEVALQKESAGEMDRRDAVGPDVGVGTAGKERGRVAAEGERPCCVAAGEPRRDEAVGDDCCWGALRESRCSGPFSSSHSVRGGGGRDEEGEGRCSDAD